MIIKAPCNLGDIILYQNTEYKLISIDWFKWSCGIEYTYILHPVSNISSDLIMTDREFRLHKIMELHKVMEIDDLYITDDRFSNKQYPLLGNGYICGINMINEELYSEVIISSTYFVHLKVQCANNGSYIDGGRVIFPPHIDEIERRERFLRNRYKHLANYNISP